MASVRVSSDVAAAMRLEPDHRDESHVRRLWYWLRTLPKHVAQYFKFGKSVPPEAIAALCRSLKLLTVPAGTLVFRQGEEGSSFYIVASGSLELLHHPVRMVSTMHTIGGVGEPGAVVGSADRARLGTHVAKVMPGRTCGDVSACGSERDCSAVAMAPRVKRARKGDVAGRKRRAASAKHTQVLQLSHDAYMKCCPHVFVQVESMLSRRVGNLMALHLFRDWPAQELGFLARWMTELVVTDEGELLYQEGEEASTVYFLVAGAVGLSCDHPTDASSVVNLHHAKAPSFFGEHEVLQGIETRVHTAETTTPGTRVLMLPASVFTALLMSETAGRAYDTAAKLRAVRDARHKWYDIRMGMAGDCAEVPFSFLEHSQRKMLLPEVCAESFPEPDPDRMAALFTRIQSGANGMIATARANDTHRIGQGELEARPSDRSGVAGLPTARAAIPRLPLAARTARSADTSGGALAVAHSFHVDAERSGRGTSVNATSRMAGTSRAAGSVSDSSVSSGGRDSDNALDQPSSGSNSSGVAAGAEQSPSIARSLLATADGGARRGSRQPPASTAVHAPASALDNMMATPRTSARDSGHSDETWTTPRDDSCPRVQAAEVKKSIVSELASVMRAVMMFKRMLRRVRARKAEPLQAPSNHARGRLHHGNGSGRWAGGTPPSPVAGTVRAVSRPAPGPSATTALAPATSLSAPASASPARVHISPVATPSPAAALLRQARRSSVTVGGKARTGNAGATTPAAVGAPVGRGFSPNKRFGHRRRGSTGSTPVSGRPSAPVPRINLSQLQNQRDTRGADDNVWASNAVTLDAAPKLSFTVSRASRTPRLLNPALPKVSGHPGGGTSTAWGAAGDATQRRGGRRVSRPHVTTGLASFGDGDTDGFDFDMPAGRGERRAAQSTKAREKPRVAPSQRASRTPTAAMLNTKPRRLPSVRVSRGPSLARMPHETSRETGSTESGTSPLSPGAEAAPSPEVMVPLAAASRDFHRVPSWAHALQNAETGAGAMFGMQLGSRRGSRASMSSVDPGAESVAVIVERGRRRRASTTASLRTARTLGVDAAALEALVGQHAPGGRSQLPRTDSSATRHSDASVKSSSSLVRRASAASMRRRQRAARDGGPRAFGNGLRGLAGVAEHSGYGSGADVDSDDGAHEVVGIDDVHTLNLHADLGL